MIQIPINLVGGLCPTLMCRAFEKARVEYFIGGGQIHLAIPCNIGNQMKQIAFNLYNGVCGTLHAIGGTHCPSNILPPPSRMRFAQTAFISVLPPTTIKHPRETSSEDFKNKHL